MAAATSLPRAQRSSAELRERVFIAAGRPACGEGRSEFLNEDSAEDAGLAAFVATVTEMFDGPDLRVICEVVSTKAVKEATEIPDELALGTSIDDLIEEVMARHDMQVPALDRDHEYVSETGSGNAIELHVPFTGTYGLFHNQPNFFGTQHPDGSVVGDEVIVPLGRADAGAKARADQWAQLTDRYLTAVGHDVEIWRASLRDQLRPALTRRRSDAEQHQQGLRSLGIPIRPRADAPPTFTKPAIVRRQPPRPERASAPAVAAPEPALSEDYYEHILFVIRAAGKAMERSPATYEGWGEEDRRQVLILMLNTHYEGIVVAEAFNGDGKTDILIREEDKNLFIGECKFYEGPKSVAETLDQTFRYATWRDVKLAMIFFVDRRDFTTAVARIKDAVEQSPQFRSWLPVSEDLETEFRAQMTWPRDDLRLVTLHVSAFLTPRSTSATGDDERSDVDARDPPPSRST